MSGNNINENISAKELQNYLKNSDTPVSIIGETTVKDVTTRMQQIAQSNTLFTVFSHHSKTTSELAAELRNSLIPKETVDSLGGET